jgi:hypothetical protein
VSDERPSDVLGALPRRRPHRRSDKRPAPNPAERSGSSPARGEDAAGKRTPTARHAPAIRARGSRPARKAPTAANAPTTAKAPSTAKATAAARPERLRQPAQPAGVPQTPRRRPVAPREPSPSQPTGRDILGIAAQAAAELAEIGLSVTARALRNAVSRLPRP